MLKETNNKQTHHRLLLLQPADESGMEVENNNCRSSSNKRTRQCGGDVDDELEADDAETKARNNGQLLRHWHHHPSSRIFRVSRASGGKDRHSKVYTSKGLRDRRVRLSVSTAIQFYDLQDRLGYDQPSKAVEWLIKAAASAIAELPSLDSSVFPQEVDVEPLAKRELAIAAAAPDRDANQNSSTSETSKGSVLSLSRSEIRERATKDEDSAGLQNNLNPSLNSQNSSFTDLLTGGGGGGGGGGIQKQHIVTSTADYFGTGSGLFEHQHQQQQRGSTTATFPSHFGNMVQFGNAGGEHHHHHHHPGEMQQFGFLQQQEEHFFPVHEASAASGGGDHYNLNFGLANFHRGTLQSNSLHHHQHHNHHQHQHQVHPALQRLSPLDGSSSAVHFLFGGGAAAATGEGQYSAEFDGHLQLCDGYKHMELKGKGKG